MSGSDWNGIKADLHAAARFSPQTVAQRVDKAFQDSLASPGDADVKGSGKPGVVTRTMGFTQARGHVAEDGAKHNVGSHRYTITESGKKSNVGGSDILTAEIDEKGKMTITSTDVKSLQSTGNVTKVSAHEPGHLKTSLTRVSKHAKEMAENAEKEGLSQSEKAFHQKVYETVKTILQDIPEAVKNGTLKLEVDNTGGNSKGVGGKAAGQDFKDRRQFVLPDEAEGGEKAKGSETKGDATASDTGEKVAVIVNFNRHGMSNAAKAKYNLGGEPDYRRDISGEKQKERTVAERQIALKLRPAGSVKPLRFVPKAIKIIKGLAPNSKGNALTGGKGGRSGRAAPGVTDRSTKLGIPEQRPSAPVNKDGSRPADVRQASQGDIKVPGAAPAGAPPMPGPPPKSAPGAARRAAPMAAKPAPNPALAASPAPSPILPGGLKVPGAAPAGAPPMPGPPPKGGPGVMRPASAPAPAPLIPGPPSKVPSAPSATQTRSAPSVSSPDAKSSARPSGAGAVVGSAKPPPAAGTPMPPPISPSATPSQMTPLLAGSTSAKG